MLIYLLDFPFLISTKNDLDFALCVCRQIGSGIDVTQITEGICKTFAAFEIVRIGLNSLSPGKRIRSGERIFSSFIKNFVSNL